MPSPDFPTVTPCELSCVLTVREAYEITYSATGVGMEPVYFRGLTLGKGTYSIPLEPSPPYGDSWKGLTHSSLEHPDTSETSPSDRHAKTLDGMKWKITTTEPSNITFEATPAPCLDVKPVYCEFSSMRAATIEVGLKPIRHGHYACGHVLLPDQDRRSPDTFTLFERHCSWTFKTYGPKKGRWQASRALCTPPSPLDIEIDVSGAGEYEFGLENVRTHSSAAKVSMPDRIPESPFNGLGSKACNAPAGSRKSNSGACGAPSNGSNSADGEIVLTEPPVPMSGAFASDLTRSEIRTLRPGKRRNDGFVGGTGGVANKRAREQ